MARRGENPQPAPPDHPEPVAIEIAAIPTAALDPLEAARTAISATGGPGPQQSSAARRWRLVIGLAASLVLAVVLTFVFLPRRTAAQPTPPAAPVQPAAPQRNPLAHHVRIQSLRPGSISLSIDNSEPTKQSLNQGAVQEFDFLNSAILRVPDGTAIEVRIDDTRVGPFRAGVQNLQLSANGVKLLP